MHKQKLAVLLKFRLITTILALALVLSGCNSQDSNSSKQSSSAEAAMDSKVEHLLAKLTLEQKIGQMIQPEIRYITPQEFKQYAFGSVLNGGGSFPNGNKYASVDEWLALADEYWQASMDSSSGIPLMWGTDAVHGHNNVIGATLFPHNIGLGAANDAELIEKIGFATATEVAATGIDWIFAPTVAVAKDDRWGRTYESYSDQPQIPQQYAAAIVKGIQATGLTATAKHFIGDGGTEQGVDQGNTVLPLDQLLAEHGGGYYKALDAGVLTVMASFNSWNGEKIHGNKQLLTDVLKHKMGFDGFVVSDWNGIGQVAGCTADNCAQAINAGIDMVMVPEDWKALYHNMIAQVKSGDIPEQRIDDAVRRILLVKQKSGILDAPKPSVRAQEYKKDIIGNPNHRALARDAVRKSLVLLKNNDKALPIASNATVAVLGSGADDIGKQSGGWTVTWQGTGNTNNDFPGATSIFGGIKAALEKNGGEAYLTSDVNEAANADVAVMVFGETPYAEGVGDLKSLAWQAKDHSDLMTLKALQALDIPVVSVFLTGRPMWVNAEINASDAFVVAWLPGSEGSGVADVIIGTLEGQPTFDFTGKLSFGWPNKDLNEQNPSLPVTDNLFDYGYGLSYAQPGEPVTDLSEVIIGTEESSDIAVFDRGTQAPWNHYLGDDNNWSVAVDGAISQTANQGLASAAVDFRVQEDARQLTWSGNSATPRIAYWQSAQASDLSALAESNGALSILLKVDKRPKSTVALRMDCSYPCSGQVEIQSYLTSINPGEWQRLSVPLSCFVNTGLDINNVDTPLVLATEKALQLTIASIDLVASAISEGGTVMSCE